MSLMMVELWLRAILLFCGVYFNTVGAYIGINIGTDVTNLPSAANIVAILKAQQITHVRLYNADVRMLHALSNTNIEVMISVTNNEIRGIGEKPSLAAEWINNNVVAYIPSTNITAISVGSEILSTIPHAAPVLVPAMNNLYKALVASNLNHIVKVSTPCSMDIIPEPFPPSAATFNKTWNSTIHQMLQFLKNTNSFYMLNAYPYYEHVKSNGIFPLEYVLFQPLSSVKQIVDPTTLFHYSSMFDALVDATYNSIAFSNFSGIPVVVTETGWPWLGGPNETDATVTNAETYNNNLITRVMNGSGPPSQPTVPVNSYIYELFNEDKRSGPVSKRNWGIFFSNGTAVYDLHLNDLSNFGQNASSTFCVARPGADDDSLQVGLNWACGAGQANCAAIQQGQSCYEPNTMRNHASYAYNDYYQRRRSVGATCDFGGSATLTNVDPSYGSCRFTGSSNSTPGRLFPPPPFRPVGPSSRSSRNVVRFGTIAVAVTALSLV